MIRDKVVFGGLIGVLSKIAMDIFQIPLWKLKMIKHPLAHYAGSLFMGIDTIHHTLLGIIISFLVDYIYAIFLGISFVYLVRYIIGKQNLILKGLLFGAFIWLFSFGGLRSLPIVKLHQVIFANMPYYFLIHMVFGLALGFFTKILGERYSIE